MGRAAWFRYAILYRVAIEFGAESAKHLMHPNKLDPFKIPMRLFCNES